MQSRYPYKLSEMNFAPFNLLFDELSDNNVSDDRLSVSVSVTANEQILEVFLLLVTMPY